MSRNGLLIGALMGLAIGTKSEHFLAIPLNGGYDEENPNIIHLRFEVQMTQINRGFFFTHVRRMMFSNVLQQSQVDGMNAILDGWEAKYTADDDRWLAYALATTYHETDQHMQPIEEYGKGRGRPYGKLIRPRGRSTTAGALCN